MRVHEGEWRMANSPFKSVKLDRHSGCSMYEWRMANCPFKSVKLDRHSCCCMYILIIRVRLEIYLIQVKAANGEWLTRHSSL